MDQIYNQCPTHITYEIAEEIFNKNNGDILKTLTELWDIKEIEPKKNNKWDDIRETCDAYDIEMYKYMNANKLSS